ncbi:hypothetical protein OROMI_015749 [Orobanche minor]
MAELCVMAGYRYPIGFHSEHVSNKLSEGFHHFLPYHGSNRVLSNSLSFNLNLKPNDERRSTSGLLDPNHFIRIGSTYKCPTLIDFQDSHLDSALLLSFGIAERCAIHEKFLKQLSSKSTDGQGGHLLDLSVLDDLMRPQSPISDLPEQSFASLSMWYFKYAQPLQNLIHPTKELCFNEPLFGQPLCNCSCIEMNDDVLPSVSDLYSSWNMNKSSRQTMLVPYFERRKRSRPNTGTSKLVATETATLKSLMLCSIHFCYSHDKTKEKIFQKKKRISKERVIYSDSYLHACESLLSIIVGIKQQGTDIFLSLKKSSPQLPRLLTRASAGIAGTGIAVILSVLCRVSCSRAPFCASGASSAGLGLGLVWLSCALNKLRDTVVAISKTSSGKIGEKEYEMMSNLERDLKDVYIRAASLMAAVVVLKVA